MTSPHHNYTLVSILAFCSALPLQGGAVSNTNDSGAGSLRDVLAAAAPSEVIVFAPDLNGATITLTSGTLNITGRQLTIDASALQSGIKIDGNSASRIFTITGNSVVSLKNLHVRNGRVETENGGGISAISSELNMENCSILGCYASAYRNGGGLYVNGITGTITRCKFQGNHAGAFGGGMSLFGVISLNISESQISGNKALSAGGIYNAYGSPVITNCSIQGNTGSGIGNNHFTPGSGVDPSKPLIRNSIVWGNKAAGSNVANMQLENSTNSNPKVEYCLIEGATGSDSFTLGDAVFWGGGNLNGITSSPNFVAAVNPASAPTTSGDLRVFADSPVLNVGNNASNSQTLDLVGKARVQQGTIDLGAFEGGYVSYVHLYPSLPLTGDANGNGYSNFLDYALGIDPTSPSSLPADTLYSTSDGSRFVTFTSRTNGIDIMSSLQTSTSLTGGSWLPMIEGTHYTVESTSAPFPESERVVLRLIALGPVRFYRQVFSH